MNGPDELSDDDFDSLTEIELDEIHADETRHDVDLFTPGSIDSIPWPTAISVRPVQMKETIK